jgi:hypothetical protein
MGIIKTAAEIAKEKLEKIGEPTEQERLKWKYGPEGEKLAALYLKEDTNLVNEVKKYDDKAKQFLIISVNDILLRNINLPRTEAARKINKKAMDGLKALKTDKNAVENVFNRIRNILDHYVQEGDKQKKQAYEALKAEFEAKLQQKADRHQCPDEDRRRKAAAVPGRVAADAGADGGAVREPAG